MIRLYSTLWLVLMSGALTIQSSEGYAKAPASFDISGQPSPSDWQYFFKLDDATRMKLWTFHQKRGRQLGHWSWEWRLGWVRACIAAKHAYCQSILDQALTDKALVVRAEIATLLGKQYAGTKDRSIISKLETMYANPRNYRNGKPLFIQQRILFAISEVGGDFAVKTGGRLAGTAGPLTRYWSKIQRL